jgi:replicative superfamily II helicase
VLKRLLNNLKRLSRTENAAEPYDGPRVFDVGSDYPCVSDPDMPFDSLNPLQSCFRAEYNKNRHCVVEAGTGTGKTVLAYIASRCFLDEGQIVVMMAPARELVKSIYREAVGIWGAKIAGLNTGNDKNVADKFFIVTTPEGFISAVRSNKPWTKAGLLIVDESHNILDPSRGGELDVAITLQNRAGGKLLLMSGTFQNKKEMAEALGADLFVSNYRRTKLHITEVHTPDDMDVVTAPKKPDPGVVATISGLVFNRDSMRLRLLKEILARHHDECVLVFVPTKNIGNCLSESLIVPFHNADINEKEKDRLVAEFRAGTIKALLATNTLSQGVNTPADVVVVCGLRRGAYYLDRSEVLQMFGRAGRYKDEAQVYILADKIELFHAKKEGLAKSLPLPVESMVLTMLSLSCCTQADLTTALGKTYSASLTAGPAKVSEAVGRYLRFLKSCNILIEKADGTYMLTKEGALLARYYLSPKQYISFVKAARKIEHSEFAEIDRGCLLLSLILPINAYVDVPGRIEKDFQMRLIALEMDKDVQPRKAAVLKHYIQKPSAIPPYLTYQLRDADRWIGMFSDMERYKIHEVSPGKTCLQAAITALKTSAAKADGQKKRLTPGIPGGGNVALPVMVKH